MISVKVSRGGMCGDEYVVTVTGECGPVTHTRTFDSKGEAIAYAEGACATAAVISAAGEHVRPEIAADIDVRWECPMCGARC